MSVYVDWPLLPFRGKQYCHMIADSHDELESMARRLKLSPSWIQKPGTRYEHYDLAPVKRDRAVRFGAQEIACKDLARKCRDRPAAARSRRAAAGTE